MAAIAFSKMYENNPKITFDFQITIKEKILKIIPKRIATFRLCPSTKVCDSIRP